MSSLDCNINPSIGGGPTNLNYLSGNQFQFRLDRIPDFTYFVQTANIPMLSSRPINQPAIFGTFPKIPATNFIFDDLQVTFLVDAMLKSWKDIYYWMRSLGNMEDFSDAIKHKDKFSNAQLLIMNSAYTPIMKIYFNNVFPITLGSLNFSVTSTTTDPIATSVNFAYSHYEIENI
jgi:hypothetical protein